MIVQPKSYTGKDLETIFFRPMLTGPDALDLGIRIMYNMPVPTTLQFWKRDGDILQKYTTGGWKGSKPADRFQKEIKLHKVKAEAGYSASDYFNMVYELITNSADVNMDDLTGTELEKAETALLKEAIAESIRATMWIGNTERTGDNAKFATFDGILTHIRRFLEEGDPDMPSTNVGKAIDPEHAEAMLKAVWNSASPMLKEMKSQGNLAFFVTSDMYNNYEEFLDSMPLDSAYQARQDGRERLYFRGIPVIDMQISKYLEMFPELSNTWAVLTDRRNLALAVNTTDFPGTEVKMWYNPDLMENRQRAVFMAGCDFLLPELISLAFLS